MYKIIALGAIGLSLGGCVSTVAEAWKRPGSSAAMTNASFDQCGLAWRLKGCHGRPRLFPRTPFLGAVMDKQASMALELVALALVLANVVMWSMLFGN